MPRDAGPSALTRAFNGAFHADAFRFFAEHEIFNGRNDFKGWSSRRWPIRELISAIASHAFSPSFYDAFLYGPMGDRDIDSAIYELLG